MKPFRSYPTLAKTSLAACLASAFALASASAVVVAWDGKAGGLKGGGTRAQADYDLAVRDGGAVPVSGSQFTANGSGEPAIYSQFDVRPILGQFVPIPDFGTYQFVSVAAASGPGLPVAFQGSATPLPGLSFLFPIVGLVVAISSTQILRRRRAAQIAAEV